MRFETKKEACNVWVNMMDGIPTEILQELKKHNCDEIRDITPPSLNDRVYVYNAYLPGDCDENYGTIANYAAGVFLINLDDGNTIEVDEEAFDVERDYMGGELPAWGTMWSFGSAWFDNWLDTEEHRRMMANCGFSIFESDRFGYFFGIDGAGYDFYEAHWLPLYDAVGMGWHDEKDAPNYYERKIA